MKVLSYEEFLYEKKTTEVSDFLTVIDDIIHIDVEHLCHRIGLTYVDAEVALDQNPDFEDSDYDYEIYTKLADDLSELNNEELKELYLKMSTLRQKSTEYIQNLSLDVNDDILIIEIAKNRRVVVV